MPTMHWIRPHIALAPLPGRFVSAHLVERDDPGREAVEAFIADVYRDRYGAVLRSFFPQLIAYRDSDGRLAAAVGIRAGVEGPLFVEHYLDGAVEHAMTRRGIAHVDRRRVVEVGNFAATSPGIARELILQLALTLQSAGMDWVLLAMLSSGCACRCWNGPKRAPSAWATPARTGGATTTRVPG
jgi:hypothetical protein